MESLEYLNVDEPALRGVRSHFDSTVANLLDHGINHLSNGNANVYYELAIRHAAYKPVIHIFTEGQNPPFDVQDMRFIPYDLKDPDSVGKAQEKIRAQANAIENGEKSITPVQVAQILAQPAFGGSELLKAAYNAIASLQEEARETKKGVQLLIYMSSLAGRHHFTLKGEPLTLTPDQERALRGEVPPPTVTFRYKEGEQEK